MPQKVSDKCFWARVQEESLASNDILQGLTEKFSSKLARKKTENSTDKYYHIFAIVLKISKDVRPSLGSQHSERVIDIYTYFYSVKEQLAGYFLLN